MLLTYTTLFAPMSLGKHSFVDDNQLKPEDALPILFLKSVYMYVLNVSLCTWVNTREGQKRVLKPMELELKGSCELLDMGAGIAIGSSI